MTDSQVVTGATRLAAVIGSPVRHSRSPILANAAFAAAGSDWTMAAFEVLPGQAGAAVAAVRTLGIGGLMVTMPHKVDVIDHLDAVTDRARALGAVNSIAWEGSRLVGDNTDGPGLVASLGHDQGIDVAGYRCVVLGGGGAARSVVWALAEAGAAEVVVVNRTADRARVAANLAGSVGRVGGAADIAASDLVVNATSVGMGADPDDSTAVPMPVDLLSAGQVVVDLVYLPIETPLLRAAAAVGATAVDGLGMLVHQAALSIERWTGTTADVGAMSAAARRTTPEM